MGSSQDWMRSLARKKQLIAKDKTEFLTFVLGKI
jgi:hypothetical protein